MIVRSTKRLAFSKASIDAPNYTGDAAPLADDAISSTGLANLRRRGRATNISRQTSQSLHREVPDRTPNPRRERANGCV